MQNIPSGLIPYSHEKYLTGKYIAETRGGFRPDEVVYLKGARHPIIFTDDDNDVCCCSDDGRWRDDGIGSNNTDLFLRPKTVKKWHPVFKDRLFETKEYCEFYYKNYNNLLKAIEVEVNEE